MKVIEKPWGFEEIIEHNDFYAFKKLGMNKSHKCSVQYHKVKRETVYLVSGVLKLYIGGTEDGLDSDVIIMKPGRSITIDPGVIHRMEAVEDSIYLEASTPELDDVVRLKDEYNRVG